LAEQIAQHLDAKVLVVDRRDHIGGNSHDYLNENGILVGKYGAHIFHTNSEKVWHYINRFAEFNSYVHRVDAYWQGRYYSIPLNLKTINSFFAKEMTNEELPAFLDSIRVVIDKPKNAEEAVISQVGWELYEAFYRKYTLKQWGVDPKELDEIMRRMRELDSDRAYKDVSELQRLQSFVAEGIKRFEYNLRRAAGADADRAVVAGSDDVPPEFKSLVEEYYRSLSKARAPK